MEQNERLIWLIKYLLNENPMYSRLEIPDGTDERFNLYRSLVNVRMPEPVSEEYLFAEDEYLQEEINKKGVARVNELIPCVDDIYLRQGDITAVDAQAIVNAANSRLLGCFCPCHACIDNCIHTFAGVRLRLKCSESLKNRNKGKSP